MHASTWMPRSCLAVPGSALSRAEQSVECSLSHGAEPGPCHQGHPCRWPAGEQQVWRSASSGHASRRPQNGESGDQASSARGRAAPRPAAAWITAGRAWPCTQLRRRLRPAPTARAFHTRPGPYGTAHRVLQTGRVARLGSYPKCVVKVTWYRKVASWPH